MSNTMKLQKKVFVHRLRKETKNAENQFRFMSGTQDSLYNRSYLSSIGVDGKVPKKQRDLHRVLIELEKLYNQVTSG